MSSGSWPRPMYWMCVLAGAFFLLAAANAAASNGLLERAGLRAKKPTPYKFTNTRTGKAVVVAKDVKPGETGTGRFTIANAGTKPIRFVQLTQDKVVHGAGPALQLQVFDSTTKRCLYPRPKLPKARPGKKPPKEPKVCLSWKPFKAGKALSKLAVPPRAGKAWKPKERHTIEVRWRLDPSSPNSDQGRTSTFRLQWRAMS